MKVDQNSSKETLLSEIERLKNELKRKKKYGLVWEEKPEEVVEMCKEKLPVLKEVKDKEIITDKDKQVNLLIEGDNYHALSVLNYTHKGKIDVIYIDPPYNTGAKNWRYNNNYVDENDAWRHSKWLSFMNHRLILAKTLLKENGALICAIDHNEQETLGLLLRKLFPSKEITCVTIVHNPRGIQGNNFAYTHEFAYFVYPKGKFINRKKRSKEDQEWSNLRNWGGESTRDYGKSLFFPLYFKNGKLIEIGKVPDYNFHPKQAYSTLDNDIIEIWPIDNNKIERKWRYSRDSLAEIKESIKLVKINNTLQAQILKSEDRYKTVWFDTRYDANIYGTQLLREIIGKEFPFPKSIYNVKDCLEAVIVRRPNTVVLDFFAGSGTTGHAVLDLNEEDGGNRQFILCTDNQDENGGHKICTDICYPRIKNVILGHEDKKGLGGNLKYFKTDFVDAEPTDINKIKLTEQATEMLCVKEGTFYPVLDQKNFKIFKNSNHYTGVIFNQIAIPDFKKTIKEIEGKFSVYIFSLGDETFDDEFMDVGKKVKLSPIPEAILRVYRRIFK